MSVANGVLSIIVFIKDAAVKPHAFRRVDIRRVARGYKILRLVDG